MCNLRHILEQQSRIHIDMLDTYLLYTCSSAIRGGRARSTDVVPRPQFHRRNDDNVQEGEW